MGITGWNLMLPTSGLLLAVYFFTYVMLLVGQMKVGMRVGVKEVFGKMPIYSHQTNALRLFLQPANQIDRLIRPTFWTWDGSGMVIDESFAIDAPQ